MISSNPLEIKVIYDASSRGRRTRSASPARPRRASRSTVVLLLGLVNLSVAVSLYYATWWKIDPFIYMKLMLHTPLPGVNLSDVSQAIPSRAGTSPDTPDETPPQSDKSVDPKFTGLAAQIALGTTAYAWLTLTTVSVCAIGLSAGALLGRAGGSTLARIGAILSVGTLLGLLYGGFADWTEYGTSFPPKHLRIGMGGLLALSTTLGLALNARARLLGRLAAVSTIVAAIGTVLALYFGHQSGAIPADQAKAGFMLAAFAIHSAWGWIVWPVTSRWVT